MTSARHGIANLTLLAAMSFSLVGCMRSIQAEANVQPMSQGAESLFLEAMFDDRRELLIDRERVAVLRLLAEAKPRFKWPWEPMSPSPHPRLKYRLNVPLSGHKQYFYFMDDGTLMHAYLPVEKARDLAGIIVTVAGRMPKANGGTHQRVEVE